MQVIPAIDLVEGKCVRLYQGDFERKTVYADDPVTQALSFASAGFSRLHVVDLEGARDGGGRNRPSIHRILKSIDIPVQLGGGIRESQDVAQLLDWGISHMILGTVVLRQPEQVEEWLEKWGPDPFIVSLDLRKGRLQSQGWLEESSLDLKQVVERVLSWGLSQVICTDVERDGTLEHPNYASYSQLLEMLGPSTSLVAAGGISNLDQVDRLRQIGVGGAIVGKALYEGGLSLEEWAGAG